MKYNVERPERLVDITRLPPRRRSRRRGRRPAHRRAGDQRRRWPTTTARQGALPAARRARSWPAPRRSCATPPPPAATCSAHALLLFLRRRHALQQARARHRLPGHRRRQPHPRHPRRQPDLHRHPPLRHVRGAGGAGGDGPGRRARGASATIPFAEFHRLPGDTPERDTTLGAGRDRRSRSSCPTQRLRRRTTPTSSCATGSPTPSPWSRWRRRSSSTAARSRGRALALGGVAHKPWRDAGGRGPARRASRADAGDLRRRPPTSSLARRQGLGRERLQDRTRAPRHRPRACPRPPPARRSPSPTSASPEGTWPAPSAPRHRHLCRHRPAAASTARPRSPARRNYAGEFAAPDLAHGYVVSGAHRPRPDHRASTPPRRGRARRDQGLHPREPAAHRLARLQLPGPGRAPRLAVPAALRRQDPSTAASPSRWWWPRTSRSARYAASLVQRRPTRPRRTTTDLETLQDEAYVPPKKRSGITPPPTPRGDADGAFDAAPVTARRPTTASRSSTTTRWSRTPPPWSGRATARSPSTTRSRASQNSQGYITGVFGLKKDDVRVLTPFVGGGFGSGLRPQYQLFLAVMAALELERSVRVVLTRDQMFTFGYRPDTLQTRARSAPSQDGALHSDPPRRVAGTSRFEDYQEVVVNWSGHALRLRQRRARLQARQARHLHPRRHARAGRGDGRVRARDRHGRARLRDRPWTRSTLRLQNYAENGPERRTSRSPRKELRACYAQGAERFGWSSAQPRAALDAGGPRAGRLGHGHRRLGSADAADQRPGDADRRRQAGGRQRHRRHRHRHLHHPDPDRAPTRSACRWRT